MKPLYGYIFAAVMCGLVLSFAGGYWRGYTHAATVAALAMTKHLELDREAELARQKEVRAIEKSLSEANALVAESYEQGKRDAKAKSDTVVSELRSGNLRLQQRWNSCESKRVSGNAASASELNAAIRDRDESAGRIIRAAAECDAQVGGLQAYIRAQREILNKR